MTEADKIVLVVDDDDDLRATLCEALESEGYRAAAAADGAQALAYLRAFPRPCVILLDLMMPNMNGWQFRAEQMRDPQLAEICTVVMTANANVQGAPIQADHFLWKPVGLNQILEAIEECCDERPPDA
jgi:CheY-like chemotaxis protein